MFLCRYYLSNICILWLVYLTKISLSLKICQPYSLHSLSILKPICKICYIDTGKLFTTFKNHHTYNTIKLNSLNLSQQDGSNLNNSNNVLNHNGADLNSTRKSNLSSFNLNNTLSQDSTSQTKFNSNTQLNDASSISILCNYDDNPHLTQQIQSRLNNYESLINNFNINPYPEIVSTDDYDDFAKVIFENESLNNGDETERCYKVYGRVEGIRFDGHFIDIVNINKNFKNFIDAELIQKRLMKNTKMQLMFRLEEPLYVDTGHSNSKSDDSDDWAEMFLCKQIIKTVDIGDVIEIYGNVKKTNLGEITIVPKKMKFLSKCLIPPPSKQHGLKDVETRFRLRHLDLMMNDTSRMYLLKRFHIISKIRKFLTDLNYMEVDTPILSHYESGELAESFETYYNRLQQKVKLRIAPEFSLKKLILGLPFKKIFEIGKCFRNEGTSLIHSPEFTMVEIYEKMADYNKMIDLFEKLVDYVLSFNSLNPFKKQPVNDQDDNKIDSATLYEVKWTRKTFADSIKEYTGIDITLYNKRQLEEKLIELNKNKYLQGQNTQEPTKQANFNSWGEVADEIFEKFVVPNLKYPVHITHMPAQISPLCYYDINSVDGYCSDDFKLVSSRFESYLGGMEVAHGCTEQCNPLILANRLVNNGVNDTGKESSNNSSLKSEDVDRKKLKSKEVDKQFLHSVFCGMEPMSGLGIGIDRLVMYITKAKNIKEVQPLPSLKKL